MAIVRTQTGSSKAEYVSELRRTLALPDDATEVAGHFIAKVEIVGLTWSPVLI